MATVAMRKGDLFADIFDSPETVAQAQKEGFHLCSEAELTVREEDRERHRRGRKPKAEENAGGQAGPETGEAPESAAAEPAPDEPPKKKRGGFLGGGV